MTRFADIADLDEDKRIEIIGHRAMDHLEQVAFVTDDIAGKADRYIRKLQEKFPGIRIIERGKGPVAHTVFVKVGPRRIENGKRKSTSSRSVKSVHD